jgi:hypothetical protein
VRRGEDFGNSLGCPEVHRNLLEAGQFLGAEDTVLLAVAGIAVPALWNVGGE